MHERLFPRWSVALFALFPLSEILYLPVNGQTMYAAAIASLLCALLCAGGARLASVWRRHRILQWLLAIFALWPLTHSLARMGIFLQHTVFTTRSLWSLILLLTICAMLIATAGLNRCAMWALPIAWITGVVVLFSGILTLGELRLEHWEAPTASLLHQTATIFYSLLPASLALALSLPDGLANSVSRGLSIGGALLALISLRTLLLLGPHTAALLPYPNFAAAGLAALSDFARHGEVFFAVPLMLCEIGRCAALACLLFLPVTHSYGVQHARPRTAYAKRRKTR